MWVWGVGGPRWDRLGSVTFEGDGTTFGGDGAEGIPKVTVRDVAVRGRRTVSGPVVWPTREKECRGKIRRCLGSQVRQLRGALFVVDPACR